MPSPAAAAADENVVVVAVKAERVISSAAIAWAFEHVARPGDLVTLLAVLTDDDDRRKGWLRWLPKFVSSRGKDTTGSRVRARRCEASASCSAAALQMQIGAPTEVSVALKVVDTAAEGRAAAGGAVAAESKRLGARWVVLDRQLKEEKQHCMKELQCNIVVVKGLRAEVLRVDLGGRHKSHLSLTPACSLPSNQKLPDDKIKLLEQLKNPQDATASCHKKNGVLMSSSSRREIIHEHNPLFEGLGNTKLSMIEDADSNEAIDTYNTDQSIERSPVSIISELGHSPNGACRSSYIYPKSSSYLSSPSVEAKYNPGIYWIPHNHILEELPTDICNTNQNTKVYSPARRTLHDEIYRGKESAYFEVREAISLYKSSPSNHPPLCTLCRHKSPLFGKPPLQFTYHDLEDATNGFSDRNLLGKGQYGCVHKGALGNGQVVAVKQLMVENNSMGDGTFHSEVESLSRAQHRNVVMLIGFCIDGKRRLLVYEYICNGSLELHLHGKNKPPLEWQARMKIAVGAARGLRYLHEDCRVGFVVHGNMRSNNILLTHDFEPLVGDLTRWQTEKMSSIDTHATATFGYQAPEYIEHGNVTEKMDVYAFGVVLLELFTGRRVLDMSQPKGQQLLTEWARPLLSLSSKASETSRETVDVDQFLDPLLDRDQIRHFLSQVCAMSYAASLCLRRDPEARPGMSKVLKVLEGDAFLDPDLDTKLIGNKSSRMSNPIRRYDSSVEGNVSLRFPNEIVNNDVYFSRNRPRFS